MVLTPRVLGGSDGLVMQQQSIDTKDKNLEQYPHNNQLEMLLKSSRFAMFVGIVNVEL